MICFTHCLWGTDVQSKYFHSTQGLKGWIVTEVLPVLAVLIQLKCNNGFIARHTIPPMRGGLIPHPPNLAPCCLSIDSLPWPEPMQKLHFSSLIFSPSSCRSVSSLDFNSFLGYAQINLNSSLLYSENLVLPVFFILQPSCWVGLGGTMAQWCITPCSEVYSLAPTFSRSSNSETSTRVWRVEPTHASQWLYHDRRTNTWKLCDQIRYKLSTRHCWLWGIWAKHN